MPEYWPRSGVGALVCRDDGVLLVRRAGPPFAGEWAVPGGKIEPGESMATAAEREVLEETGVRVRAGEPVFSFDHREWEPDGSLRFHYVVVDLVCEWLSGEPRGASDAAEACWVPWDQLDSLPLNRFTRDLLSRCHSA